MNNKNKNNNTAKNHEPLSCMSCGEKDLLETQYGVIAFVKEYDGKITSQYTHAYWACKGRCDMQKQVALSSRRYLTSWKGISELTNPLEFARWDRATSGMIDRGEISETAAAKVEELKRIVAPIADREPTEQDIARFWEIRMMDGL